MKISPPYPTGSVPDLSQIYPPREDTLLLFRAAKVEIHSSDLVLEIGTGNGFIASGIQPYVQVIATDINPHAVKQAKLIGLEVIRTNLAGGLRRIFSVVIFNPPYLPTKKNEKLNDWLEFALDGGPDGRKVLIPFLTQMRDVLIDSGRILLLISSLQHFNTCEELFTHTGFEYSLTDSEKLEDGEEIRVYRLVWEKKRNG